MMEQRRDQDLRAADRAQLDRRRQEDLARLEYSGNVPTRQKGPSEGIMESFENHPMLWALVVVVMGGLVFFLVTRILV